MISMKKKTKIVIGVAVLTVLIGSFVGFIMKRNSDHAFGQYVVTEGPWGTSDKWFSGDGKSYLECKKEADAPFATVTAYFEVNGEWQSYELNTIDRLAYLEKVEDGISTETKQGRLEFDGTRFTIYELDKNTFGNDKFDYFQSHIITGEERNPD